MGSRDCFKEELSPLQVPRATTATKSQLEDEKHLCPIICTACSMHNVDTNASGSENHDIPTNATSSISSPPRKRENDSDDQLQVGPGLCLQTQ